MRRPHNTVYRFTCTDGNQAYLCGWVILASYYTPHIKFWPWYMIVHLFLREPFGVQLYTSVNWWCSLDSVSMVELFWSSNLKCMEPKYLILFINLLASSWTRASLKCLHIWGILLLPPIWSLQSSSAHQPFSSTGKLRTPVLLPLIISLIYCPRSASLCIYEEEVFKRTRLRKGYGLHDHNIIPDPNRTTALWPPNTETWFNSFNARQGIIHKANIKSVWTPTSV